MAVPTITLIAPATGHTGGRTLVEIQGTGFQLPADPPDTGIAPVPPPSVRVTFGGVEALDVAVESDTVLFALSPISPASSTNAKGQVDIGPGVVDIVVANIDEEGVVISGETVTAPAAFEYVRPDLSQESHVTIAVGCFIDELRRQILPNVDFAVHTDYSDNDGNALNLAYLPTLPALLLTDLEFPDSIWRPHGAQEVDIDAEDDGAGRFAIRREPDAVDATMTVMGIADLMVEGTNLFVAMRGFFKKNPTLAVPRNPEEYRGNDPTSLGAATWPSGALHYAMEYVITEPVRVNVQGSNTNIKTFAMACAIRGILVEGIGGLPGAGTTGTPSTIDHEGTIGIGTVAEDVTLTRAGI